MMLIQVESCVDATACGVEFRIVDQAQVRKHCAFGETGGARGVLDLRGIFRLNIGQIDVTGLIGVQRRFVFQVGNFLDS